MFDVERIMNWERWRIIAVSTVSPLFGYLTPTKGFVYALVVMFAFNIWAGMTAWRLCDAKTFHSVSSKTHCANFCCICLSWRRFL